MKGQYFSFDAIIASLIFLMAIVSLISYWHSIRTSVGYQNSEMLTEAFRISDLLMGPGYPPDVDCVDMNQIGLAISNADGRVKADRIDECSKLDAQGLRNRTLSAYNLTVEVWVGNDVTRLGPEINLDFVDDVVKVRRVISIYNETSDEGFLGHMDIYLYR